MREWNKTGIPHKGWKSVDVYDLAEFLSEGETLEYEKCEMCGKEKIRFVHVMRHPNYSDDLHVGCVCAEKMTDDYVNPHLIEDRLRNRAERKRNFNRAQWNYNSDKGTYSKKYKGEWITIVKSKYGSYGVFIAGNRIWKYNNQIIENIDDAKNIAFDIFEEFHTTGAERY